MATAITSHKVRITFNRVSLTDPEIYYHEFDALVTDPLIVDAFEEAIKANTIEFTNVQRRYYTGL